MTLGNGLKAGLLSSLPVAIVTRLPVTLAVHFYEAEHHPRPALFGFPPLSIPLGPVLGGAPHYNKRRPIPLPIARPTRLARCQ